MTTPKKDPEVVNTKKDQHEKSSRVPPLACTFSTHLRIESVDNESRNFPVAKVFNDKRLMNEQENFDDVIASH